jgi:hypothetical protein
MVNEEEIGNGSNGYLLVNPFSYTNCLTWYELRGMARSTELKLFLGLCRIAVSQDQLFDVDQ